MSGNKQVSLGEIAKWLRLVTTEQIQSAVVDLFNSEPILKWAVLTSVDVPEDEGENMGKQGCIVIVYSYSDYAKQNGNFAIARTHLNDWIQDRLNRTSLGNFYSPVTEYSGEYGLVNRIRFWPIHTVEFEAYEKSAVSLIEAEIDFRYRRGLNPIRIGLAIKRVILAKIAKRTALRKLVTAYKEAYL